jgi:hypothetical protein
MSEMKETAVDVLIHKIHKELDWFYPKVKLSQKLIDEIKAMEKEQIKNAWLTTRPNTLNYWRDEFEQYYNETFKQE